MNNRTVWRAAILPAVMYFIVACGGLSTQQQAVTENALTALRRLEAASQIRTSSYREYSQLVIEAKAQVNQAGAVLPDGELKKELTASMDAYADAATAWTAMLGNNYLSADHEPGKNLSPKYQFNLSGPAMPLMSIMMRSSV